MSKSVRKTLEPGDLFGAMEADAIPIPFGNNNTRSLQRGDVIESEYQNVPHVGLDDNPDDLSQLNYDNQTSGVLIRNSLRQFGANIVSSFGQGLANTFDLISNAKTIKGLTTGSNDDFSSSLFGISTRDMQNWANGVAERNDIIEKDPDSFNLSDPAWWAKQVASTGTGIGMAGEALLETAAIEYASGGLGTGEAIAKLGSVVKRIAKGARGAEELNDAFKAVSGMKSAATIYGAMNRLNESRMEGTNTYDDIYQTLSDPSKTGGKVFSEEEKQHLASEGAKVDYKWNLALLPLDMLSYRSMVFNPVSGSATNWVERGLEDIAGMYGKSKLGKAAGWLTDKVIGSQLEGGEEGFQQIGQDEGRHYAMVLGGMDDGKNFMQRLGEDVSSDEFWNNYAGGVLGSPIIGAAMNLVNRVTTNNRANRLDEINKNYVKEAGKMNADIQNSISKAEKSGNYDEANRLRRMYNVSDTISRLHIDAQTDKTSAFDSRLNFLQATLGELNEGKTTSLQDVGFFDINPETDTDKIAANKANFETYVADAQKIKSIYDSVKGNYNRNFLPAITYDNFVLRDLQDKIPETNLAVTKSLADLPEYSFLSSSGKQIHDIDYQIQATTKQHETLTNLYRNTDDIKQKENIEKLLKANETEQTRLKESLDNIQNDENYTPKDKESDNDILESRSSNIAGGQLNINHLQNVYNKISLDDAVSLQRKNVALWNNPEYIQEKTQQATKHAKTTQQTANNIEAPVKNKKGELVPANKGIIEANKKKEAEIIANNTLETPSSTLGNSRFDDEEGNVYADDLMRTGNIGDLGNSSLGDDDYHTPPSNNKSEDSIPDFFENGNVIASFSPVSYDFNKSSDEAKNNVRIATRGLLSKLDKPSFEDLVREFYKLKGADTTDKLFEALKYGYKANGNELSDEDATFVYQKVFGNPADDLVEAASQLLVATPSDLVDKNIEVHEDVIAEQGQPEGFDSNNKPVYVYKNTVTDETSPKGAFISRPSRVSYKKNQEGITEIDYEYTGNVGDGNNEYINSDPILDPDQLNEGAQVEIRVPANVDEISVPIFKANGEYSKSMPFGQWVAEQSAAKKMSIEEFSKTQEYKDKIPMIHYAKGISNEGKGIMFVHDIGWYAPSRFVQDKPDDMEKAIANTRAVREEVLNTKNKSTDATITGKRQTTFEGLLDKNKDNPLITIREANPQAELMVIMNDGTPHSSRKTSEFPNNKGTALINDPGKYFKSGQVVDVRRYGTKDGVKTYVASPIFKGKISDEIQASVFSAIYVYIDSKNPIHKSVIDSIQKGMGLDITTRDGLRSYLNHFIKVQDFKGANSTEDVNRLAKSTLAYGTPYITFIGGGNILFGQAGVSMYTDSGKKKTIYDQLVKDGVSKEEADKISTERAKVYSKFLNNNSPQTAKSTILSLRDKITVPEKQKNTIVNVPYKNRLAWFDNNMDIDNYSNNNGKPIITITKGTNGGFTTKTIASNYKEHLMNTFKTNFKSYNIGTEAEPNYVSNIQPIVTYDTNKRLGQQEAGDIKEQVETGKTEEVKVDTPPIEIKVTGLSDELKAKIEASKKRLGTDLGNKGYSASPTILTREQRNTIADSIDDIGGLDPIDQSTVVNGIYNEIISRVNFDSGKVVKSDLQREIKKAFTDLILKTRDQDIEEIKSYKDLISSLPKDTDASGIQELVDSFQSRVDKANAIKDNYEKLEKLAFVNVDKYTGITQSREKLEVNESEDNYEYKDKDNENPTDFYTDVFTESPDNKVTYSMRRFFGNIRQYDKDGNQMTGTLGIPLYTSSSEIISALQNSLVDVPADFKSMIDKLGTLTEKYPWMQAVINKLNTPDLSNQKKNQFIVAMANTKLRMVHSVLAYNRNNNRWNIRVEDTNTNGVANVLKEDWKNNLTNNSDFNLFMLDENGNDILNKEKAKSLINTFEDWAGLNIPTLETNLDTLKKQILGITKGSNLTITPAGNLLNELKTKIVKNSDRLQFSMANRDFQISQLGNDKYKISILDRQIVPKNSEVEKWLRGFGIVLSPKTIEELQTKGLFHNGKRREPKELMMTGNSDGLYGILYNELKDLINYEGTFDFSVYGKNPLDNSVIGSLANLEARYNTTVFPSGFRVNGKTYFALTASKFATDRGLELTGEDDTVRRQLGQVSFSQSSMWLQLLQDKDFRDKFGVYTDSAETLKEKGKKSYKSKASIVDLSPMDHELAKTSKFFDMSRGNVVYGDKSSRNYMDTTIPLRMAVMPGLTSSDKSIMLDFNTAVLNLTPADLKENISDQLIKTIYEQTVRPELLRMIKFAQNGNTNVSGYNEGAKMFFIIPEMNNVKVSDTLSLADAIAINPNKYNQNFVESGDIKDSIYETIRKSINGLVEEKLKVWNDIGIKEVNDKQGNKYIDFIDGKYLDKFGNNTTNEEKIRYAAMDYEINSLIANANNMMLFVGDPALYYKSKSSDTIGKIKDTSINLTKRLANQIAPAHKLANSRGDKYLQLFIEDRKSVSNNIDYLEKLYGKDNVDPYREIKAADAQEYTTWKEHLDNLTRLGKTADFLMDITPEDIDIARRLISSGKNFSDREMEIVRKVMQPLKPRYNGQIYDKEQDMMRTVYIKSSSFPLIPQLTKGLEIDKLRQKMEEIEKEGLNVRASHQTANKVGSMNNAAKIWNKDGTINDEALSKIKDSSLVLDREGYGIQQEVPYKSYKNKVDTVTLGTQLMKLLFGDGMMNIDGFKLDGKSYNGTELHQEYTNAFLDLLSNKQGQLFDELGLDKDGNSIDKKQTTIKLQKLLNDEAVKRGYPLQDIKALKLNENNEFTLPLWASVNSNRFESMLNSIISNRMVAMKLPGTSLVTGSEEGFNTKKKLNNKSDKDINDSIIRDTLIKGDYYYTELVDADKEEYSKPTKITTSNIDKAISLGKQDGESIVNKRGIILGMPEPRIEVNGIEYIDIEDLRKGTTDTRSTEQERNEAKAEYDKLTNNTTTEDNLTNQQKSNIVFTSAWNGKELQSTFTKDGKLQMAQVFLPSKFRDNNGELIDLLDSKYTHNDNGHLTLKEEMFDKDLLSSLSFRIPTSGHQSGSRIEIAGFLPHTMGDLIIVPKTFTTQKGLDFDIDKENLYNLWTRVNKEGKIEVLNEKHRTEILDEAIKAKESGDEAANTFFDSAFGTDTKYTKDEINSDKKLKKANSEIDEKLLQNKIVKITKAVYENPANEVQAKINKTLSTEYAESQANMIDKLTNNKTQDKIWSPLSSEYQKNAMLAGASGKTGTGAYSLDVVSHSLFQQALAGGKALSLKKLIENEEGKLIPINRVWRFGNITSYSELGREKTVDGSRNIADVQAERQNIAVDNATLGVMGKVNLNDLTMDVDKVLNMTGIDKGEDGNSISFLFLSQPIIWEYVAQMKNANSIMASFENDKEMRIVNGLIKKYDPREDEELEPDYEEVMSDQMTNTNFIAAIKSDTPDGRLQAAVLRRFIDLKNYGIEIRGIQAALNFKNNSLGKSFFDVIEKKNAINKLGFGSKTISNVDALIGDYLAKEDYIEAPEGYTYVGNYYVKPTTVVGGFNIKATMTAYNLWGKYFPYDKDNIKTVFAQVIDSIGSGDMSPVKTVELKQEVFSHIKKYLSTSNKNGIISSDDNVNKERHRLYIDDEKNTSLAKYLYNLLQANDNGIVNKYLKTNKLINSFKFNINKDGQPSLIRYNNASGEQFDEQYLYEGLSQLLKNIGESGSLALPKIGNKEYTLDTLAQDLIAYTFLGNSTQEAIQFAKFVPVSYLNEIGYSSWVKNNLEESLGLTGETDLSDAKKHLLKEFVIQYVQHNPNKVKVKYDNNSWQNKTTDATFTGKRTLDNLETFKVLDEISPSFISIYNKFGKTKKDKQQLYWFDGAKYTRVDTLGTFGMDEYQQGLGIGKSIVNGTNKLKINPQTATAARTQDQEERDPFNVESKSIKTVLSNISKANISGLSELANEIIPFIGNTTIDEATAIADKTNFNGIYLHDEDAIYINNKLLAGNTLEKKAQIIVEEVLHSLTVNQIKNYITQNADGSVDANINTPDYVTDIVRIYNNVRSKVDNAELQDIFRRVRTKDQGITSEEFNTTYGLTDIYEFMAQTFANKEFQKFLSRPEFNQSGESLLEKFKAAVVAILNKMGINFSQNSATVQAFNSIFEFIQNENPKTNISKENQKMKDDVDNFDENTFYSNDIEPNFSPSNFPNKTLNIIEEKCI